MLKLVAWPSCGSRGAYVSLCSSNSNSNAFRSPGVASNSTMPGLLLSCFVLTVATLPAASLVWTCGASKMQ